jgi:hypothetical protein
MKIQPYGCYDRVFVVVGIDLFLKLFIISCTTNFILINFIYNGDFQCIQMDK